MKKKIFMLLMAATLILSMPSFSFAQDSSIHVKVDGEVVNFDSSPFIQNNKTYIPVRGVFEKMGAKVLWNNNSKEIIVYKGRTVLVLILNNIWSVIDDRYVDADATPIMINSKTYVPVRFISEALGATVKWDQQTQTINIVQNPVDDSEKSLIPLYNIKERFTTKGLDTPPQIHIFKDTFYVPYQLSPERDRLAALEKQHNLIRGQIIAAKQCIENDKKNIIDGSGSEELLKMDEANLKELEPKLVPLTEELKKFEENILKTISTL
ncbi:copper amine oxidase N-terminal domain-containing protein [Aminipila terrae]|uniref:Copper amine oxidase-like N-terminal domain-containing protein n=1 Tax=Aminipila terrae TaxID=2697030 RepID=A0A6P1MG89_9FIRM|nr:copper amine oxidase N-terminal domain-containing protein [Aminipila terrae]QHI73719.1 hypothetical protein Ami3637_16235 [Aminipila terrae]